MLIEIDKKKFKSIFIKDPHPFISTPFIELNKDKVDEIVYLVDNKKNKIEIGLIAGIKNNTLISPFSAPFGGFHFKKDKIYINKIEQFLDYLKQYIVNKELNEFKITLPPDIYQQSFNAKLTNSMIRKGFHMEIPQISSYIDLKEFSGNLNDKVSRTFLRQAMKNELTFYVTDDIHEKEQVYNVTVDNRKMFNRPVYMTFEDILKTSEIWQTDYFLVRDVKENIVASAIFYRFDLKNIYGVYWGDNIIGRPLRSMDFLSYNIWNFYKKLGFEIIDVGTSTESGVPNEGLLRFKETHNCTSTLRYTFSWQP